MTENNTTMTQLMCPKYVSLRQSQVQANLFVLFNSLQFYSSKITVPFKLFVCVWFCFVFIRMQITLKCWRNIDNELLWIFPNICIPFYTRKFNSHPKNASNSNWKQIKYSNKPWLKYNSCILGSFKWNGPWRNGFGFIGFLNNAITRWNLYREH